ncbi:MAG: hypothetical protein GXO27_01970 [Chlorobi bacterium]|nr:hypothetical protein [Chlorobiota bacterium]
MRAVIGLIALLTALTACHGPSDRPARPASDRPSETRTVTFTTGNLTFPEVPPEVLDTFTPWIRLTGYFRLDSVLTEEEVKDRTELILGSIRRIRAGSFPPALNTPAVKSRLLRLETETRQLRWVLERGYREPRPDSLYRRMLYAYYHLAETMRARASKDENFAEIFEAKQQRDELLKEKLRRTDSLEAVERDSARLQAPLPDDKKAFPLNRANGGR